MNEFSCQTVKDIVFQLMNTDILKDKVFIAGGIVPYIYSSRDSGRKHTDIDIVVKDDDMLFVRQYLKSAGYYQKDFDSIEFDYNSGHVDYGIEVFIQDIPVSFAPFKVIGNDIIQKNFLKKELSGYDALVKVTMCNIAVEDYITHIEKDGLHIGTYTLEMVKCAKENSNREKDIHDIREIERIGINKERYTRVKPVIQNMRMDAITPDNVDAPIQ